MHAHDLKIGLEVVDGSWKGVVHKIFEGRITCILKGERPAGVRAEWEARVDQLELSKAEEARQRSAVEKAAAPRTISLQLTYTQVEALRWAVGFSDLKPGGEVPDIPMYQRPDVRELLHTQGGLQDFLDRTLKGVVDDLLAEREHDRVVVAAGLDKENLSEGTWDCEKSPTKLCWYDWNSDLRDDECIYCGAPDERK